MLFDNPNVCFLTSLDLINKCLRVCSQELVIDVVKEELEKKTGMSMAEVNDWVIRKTVGGPLR